jgi:Lar family restriction alleviation protein
MSRPLTPEMLVERLERWQDRTHQNTTARLYQWIACFADDLEDAPVPEGFTLQWRTGGRAVVAFAASGESPGELDEPCDRQRAVDTAVRLKGGSRSNMVDYTFALLIGGKPPDGTLWNRVFCLERKHGDWTSPETGLLPWMKRHLWPDPTCGTCDRYRSHTSRIEYCPALHRGESPGGYGSELCDFVASPDFTFDVPNLSRCPFCGGEPFPDVDGRHGDYAVACRACKARGPAKDTLTAAAEAWNTRDDGVREWAEKWEPQLDELFGETELAMDDQVRRAIQVARSCVLELIALMRCGKSVDAGGGKR